MDADCCVPGFKNSDRVIDEENWPELMDFIDQHEGTERAFGLEQLKNTRTVQYIRLMTCLKKISSKQHLDTSLKPRRFYSD